MARSMRLLLIRHGETVDNVAQLYAGSRDSALTNHGHQQATRLGVHLQALGLSFTHLFSSHLQRAAKTASLVREAQLLSKDEIDGAVTVPDVQQLCILMEQDFGDLEGKKWTEMPVELQKRSGYMAVETKEDMGRRADTFLDDHLLPLLDDPCGSCSPIVAIVSHGIFLSTLWKRLLRRLPIKSITLSPDLQSTARPSLEHLGGWSNTGYLDLRMTRDGSKLGDIPSRADASGTNVQKILGGTEAAAAPETGFVEVPDTKFSASVPCNSTTPHASSYRTAGGWSTTILAINGRDHLKGLKRTGGGVGSSRHDASQKGIESFFKRRKVN